MTKRIMKKIYIGFSFLVIGLLTIITSAKAETMFPPMKIPLYLSGNFGELRGSHFHSGLDFKKSGIDTLKLSRRLLPEVPHKTLEYLCGYFGIDAGNSHRAYDDALSAMKLYEKLHQIKPDDTGFDELIELNYSAKKDSPITAAQRKYLIALTEKHGLEPVEDIDALTKSRASKLIDNIISNYGK